MSAGDKAFWSDVALAIRPPRVRLVQQIAQTLNHNTVTPLTFGAGSEDIDTDNFHDTAVNPTRVTPTIPGYYTPVCTLWLSNNTGTNFFEARVLKNGAVQEIARNKPDTANSQASSVTVASLVAMNGSTDYLEFAGLQFDGASVARATLAGVGFVSTFVVKYDRPL